MTVTVKLFSIFAKHLKDTEDGKLQLRKGASVLTLSRKLKLPIKFVRIIAVNGKQGDLKTKLVDGDTVFIFPPAIGGG